MKNRLKEAIEENDLLHVERYLALRHIKEFRLSATEAEMLSAAKRCTKYYGNEKMLKMIQAYFKEGI